jgi:hypothetical protein
MERAREAQVVGDVQRGLAIIVHLFPELSGWLADVQLDIPLWEKALALRVATWRLTAVEIQG